MQVAASSAGQMGCHPSGFRVWQGWRTPRYQDRISKFHDKLGSIFLPVTVQLMEPLGMKAYLPAISPVNDNILPDEIALVAYPSQETYLQATREVAVGRAYGALHATVFNFDRQTTIPSSRSDFPRAWTDDWQLSTPYYLIDMALDWQAGSTGLLMARRRNDIRDSEFHELLRATIDNWRQQRPSAIDGSIVVVEQEYLIYWEHRSDTGTNVPSQGSLIPALSELLGDVVMRQSCEPIRVKPLFEVGDTGLPVNGGEFYNVSGGDYRR